MNFLAEQNILRYRALLETETDPHKRSIVEDLLAREQAKLRAVASLRTEPGGTTGSGGRGGG